MIVEIVTAEIDFRTKENIRYARIKAGIDQVTLAQRIGVSEGYIGGIENPKNSAKANIRLLSRIAVALGLDSYSEIMPKEIIENDIVRLRLDLFNTNTRNQVVDANGKVPERLKVLSKVKLSEKEYQFFKDRKQAYCTIIE